MAAMASEVASASEASPSASLFWRVLVALMALVLSVVTIWDKVKPRPPLHQQFASIDHSHSKYARREEDLKAQKHECTRERLTIRSEMGEATEKFERQIDYLRNTIIDRLNKLSSENEERASHIHSRIDPIIPQVAANRQAVTQHLADHRAGRDN